MPNIQDNFSKLEDAMNRRDKKAYMALYHPDAVVIDPMYSEPLQGSAAIEEDMSNFFDAFPDLEGRVERVITNSDTCAAEFTLAGTHKGLLHGPAGDIEATNEHIELHMSAFTKFDEEGRIIEEHRYYDTGTLLGQLGLTA
jgi:steroid delta-isomerase-like uncharacterized protein